MNPALLDYYRLPADLFLSAVTNGHSVPGDAGFFQFGAGNVCYGRCRTGVAADIEGYQKFDALKDVRRENGTIHLPFDFAEVVENLRRERYREKNIDGSKPFVESNAARAFYYSVRNYLPVSIRRRLQRGYLRDWKQLPFPAWPVDATVDDLHKMYLRLFMEANELRKVPFIWFWPDGAPNCLILTHDVETSEGRDFSSQLMDLDDSYGFKASFQVVPEQRYEVPNDYVFEIRERGFEFNVHDLNHDGRLYMERQEFLRRAARINAFIGQYKARGFRAGSMYRNQDWYDAFEFSYDMSVPNVAHLDPMRGGCGTVMPYFVGKILELPLTTAQDYSLFYILKDYSIELWKKQLALLRSRHGLISAIAHPDYLIEQRARNAYASLLDHLRQIVTQERIWAALPGDVDVWWRARDRMNLVSRGGEWEIVGAGSERARLAYAVFNGKDLRYELAELPNQAHAFGIRQS